MGWVLMSERELNRVEVLSQVTQGRMTAAAAANVLGLSRRQVHRLGIERIGPAHCTGWHAARQIWNAFDKQCFLCSVGTQVSF